MLSTVADDSHCLFTDKSLWTNQSSSFAKVLARNRDGPIFRKPENFKRRCVTLESLLSKVFFPVTFERKLSSVTWALDFLWKDAGSKFWLLQASSRTACLHAWHSFILLLDRFLPQAEDVPVPPFISYVKNSDVIWSDFTCSTDTTNLYSMWPLNGRPGLRMAVSRRPGAMSARLACGL